MLFKAELGKDVRIINPDVPLLLGEHDLTIRVLAMDQPARVAKATLEIEEGGLARLTPLQGISAPSNVNAKQLLSPE